MASNLDLFKAIEHKDQVKARKLLDAFPTMLELRNYKGATGLILAAVEGDPEMVRLFLDKGAKVQAKCNQYLYSGQTALHLAAGMGYLRVVQVLLEHDAEVNATDVNDETPLHEAAVQGRNEMVSLLLRYGAQIDAKQKDGLTPLYFAIINGHLDTVKLLVAKGADITSQAQGLTPAIFAEMNNKPAIAAYLRKHGSK